MKILSALCCLLLLSCAAYALDTTIVVTLSNDDSAPVGAQYYEGDRISSTDGMELTLPDGSEVALEKNTEIRVSQMRQNASKPVTKIQLVRGGIRARVKPRRGQTFEVATPLTTAGVRGTDFSVEHDPAAATTTGDNAEASEVDVYDGTVGVLQTTLGTTENVEGGSGATVSRRKLLRRTVSEERRERWEDRREAIIAALKLRWNLSKDATDEELAEKLKEKLKHLSAERREALQKKFGENLKDHRERLRNRTERRHDRRTDVRENHQDKRENVRENRSDRRENVRDRRDNRR